MTTARNANLDALRAVAILAVLVSHTLILAPQKHGVVISWVGQFGVDLFFVLSGWLIGGLFWRELRDRNAVNVPRFVARRVLRTVPPYYLILPVAWLAAYYFSPAAPPFHWRFVVFLQNYLPKIPFFSISWSLCVEEHFYLIFPMAMTLFLQMGLPIRWVLLATVAASPVARTLFETTGTVDEFDATVLGTHLRLDGLALGMLVSHVFTFDPELWRKVRVWSRKLLPVSIAFPLVSPFMPDRLFYEIGLTLMAASFAVFVINASEDPTWHLARVPGIQQLAKISYSLYLVHSLTIHVVRQAALMTGTLAQFCYWLLVPVVLLIVGHTYFRLVEKPTFRLRDWVMGSRSRS